MTNHLELGKKGEEHAIQYILTKGYTLLEKNWRSGKLEVDIIAEDIAKKQLVIIEVKTRTSNYFIEPEIAVDRQKQRFLVLAANRYVQYKNIHLETRFDIIAITIVKEKMHLNHIEDAFYAMM